MKNYNMILIERLQKYQNLSSGKIDKYQYLTDEKILPSNQKQIIEQAKFTYSPLGNAFKKQTKTIEDQQKIHVFGNDIKNNFINMSMENAEQNHLAKHIRELKSKTRPQDRNLKRVKKDILNSAMTLLKGREMVFKDFESGIFLKSKKLQQSEQSNQSSSDDKYTSLKLGNDLNTSSNDFSSDLDIPLFTPKNGTGLKILTPKQMLQRLPIALAQVKAGNTLKHLLNEIR